MKDEDTKIEFDLGEWIACKSADGGFTGLFLIGLFWTIIFIIEVFLTVGPPILAIAFKWWLISLWIVTMPTAIGIGGWIDSKGLWY